MGNNKPIYISKACLKSFWNEYRLYNDHIELKSWLCFKTFFIPYDELISIGLFEPPVFKSKLLALKLDWADLNKHVGIQRKNGWFKFVRFTPQNPEEFISKVQEYLNTENL